MKKISAGYWSYTIDLGTQTGATVCFNNGSGSWDSNGKSNYTVGVGASLVTNGSVSAMDATATPTLEPTPTPINQSYVTVDFDNSVSKWENVYAYVWNNTEDYKVFSRAYVSGKHYIFNITGSYKYILFKNTEDKWDQQTADLLLPEYTTSAEGKCFKPYSADNKSEGGWETSAVISNRKSILPSVVADKDTVVVGDAVKFTMTAEYENGSYKNRRSLQFVYEDGTVETLNSSESASYTSLFDKVSENTFTYTWTPSKAGTIKVIYSVNEYEDHGEDSQAITLNVKAASNTLKLYYKNSSWSNAYVHYKVNNNWTTVPGMKMQASDRSDYTWMYTIDLGDATSATFCFNDGNGKWANNNNSNYTAAMGVYGISGNTVTAIK